MLETMPEKLIAYGIEKGIEKGKEEGKEEGIKESKEKIALNMLKKGMLIEDISEITGFPIEYIEKLKQK